MAGTSPCGRSLPAALFLLVWQNVSGNLVYAQVLASPEAANLPGFGMQRSAILNEAYALATGASTTAFNREAFALAPVYARALAFYNWIGFAVAMLVAFAGGAWAFSRVSPALPRPHPGRAGDDGGAAARLADRDPDHARHRPVAAVRIACASSRWSRRSSSCSALNWSPQMAIRADQAGSSGAFGAIPLFWGTIFIGAIIAMIVAIPLGPDERDLPHPICEAAACAPG